MAVGKHGRNVKFQVGQAFQRVVFAEELVGPREVVCLDIDDVGVLRFCV